MKRATLVLLLLTWSCSSESVTYVSDASPPVLGAFGEPCSATAPCESGICVPTAGTDVCSETCTEGSCPTGYLCQSVGGQDLCMPENPLLCAACSDDGDCAAEGDVCLSYVNGKTFCAQDCSAVGCPAGYQCQTVEVEGSSLEQCVPVSGACDCNATASGVVEPCSISHDFGTCAGSRSCEGASGWGACEPPSATDLPDPAFTDDNCDGIDGEIAAAIFVATSGADGADCGLGHATPCQSVSHAIARAVAEGRTGVYIQAGSYEEGAPIVLASGVGLYGGYDTGWQRGPHTDADHQVTLRGGADADTGALVTLHAAGIDDATVVADLVIAGPDGGGADGAPSLAVFVGDSTGLALQRVTIDAGNGATGAPGGDGASASPVAAPGGNVGGNGSTVAAVCDDSSRAAGGAGGEHSCAGTSTGGGDGGDSGTVDTSCPLQTDPRPGLDGDDVPPATEGGPGGPICEAGMPGEPGAPGQDGAGGDGAAAGGVVMGSIYRTSSGTAGGLGSNGRGGGGGGGAGGCDNGTDAYGGGGGGGGAGGCRATSAGGGGQGGGASVGLYLIDSDLVVAGCAIERGVGGDGGPGGDGGSGQPGGPGAGGGIGANAAKGGGQGGNGGDGGDSGGGGGGAGGDSVGIALRSSTIDHDCVISGGTAGAGGSGGASAGNPGGNGASGRVLEQLSL